MTNAIEYMFRNFAYAQTSVSNWQEAIGIVTKSDHAGLMLSQWFSRETRPVLLLTVTPHTIVVEQITTDLWIVPVEVVGSTGTQTFIVTNESTVVPYSTNDYVIADPQRKSTAMIIYDVDSYIRLIRCWEDSRCPVKHNALRGIFRDLGAVLLADKLQPPGPTDVPKWKTIFRFTLTHHILTGNAACCTEYAVSHRAEISCAWIVRDTCEKIRFINSVAS
ncbi:hypothetical protein KIN20_003268 [Parelaphostrongylus tenuis]|uniref:Uncharacterized protein n=1 Tax=Parelaphostrongylus tenuis TaxID=148309 RepID=A0AAD5MFE9_PARTN|nr:hypothetical protein KIN20_003268 [Parelaphostrongylus tenuis]